MKRFLSVLALCWALLLNSPKEINAESDLHIGLFPEQPIYRTIMADPDIPENRNKSSAGTGKRDFGKTNRRNSSLCFFSQNFASSFIRYIKQTPSFINAKNSNRRWRIV